MQRYKENSYLQKKKRKRCYFFYGWVSNSNNLDVFEDAIIGMSEARNTPLRCKDEVLK